MNFAITALGRCGTTSLAEWLGRNKAGTRVVHEQEHAVATDAAYVNKRMTDKYGEVNSYLRFVLDEIDCDKKAVIIRHPYRILLSAVNRNSLLTPEQWAQHIDDGLNALDQYLESGVRLIRFELLTHESPNHRDKLAKWLGFDPANLGEFPKANPTAKHEIDRIKGTAVERLYWFALKYYDERNPDTADLSKLRGL